MLEILKGSLAFSVEAEKLITAEEGYIVLEDGRIRGVYRYLPEAYRGAWIKDYGNAIITPSFTDMHLHAPQYAMLGLGMDLQLIDWLNAYAFKTEAMFADEAYARAAYRQLAAELIAKGTTRVCMFSSLHRRATLILMEELERAGVTGYVGKVNMDRNGGANLQEETEESIRETLLWLDEGSGFRFVKPMLTPRFTPACTDELLTALGKIARERDLPVQSHLSENQDEIAWVRSLHPDCAQYWETYDKYGLWKKGTVMAHCVYSDEQERAAIKRAGVVVAHCADSNTSIRSGIAPVRRMLAEGLFVTLGSDIAGGAKLCMLDAATEAIRASKHRWRETGEDFLKVNEAFYLITGAGQGYFGAQPGFGVGDMLHAVVLDDRYLPETRRLTLPERLERLMYIGGEREIAAVYSEGRKVK